MSVGMATDQRDVHRCSLTVELVVDTGSVSDDVGQLRMDSLLNLSRIYVRVYVVVS